MIEHAGRGTGEFSGIPPLPFGKLCMVFCACLVVAISHQANAQRIASYTGEIGTDVFSEAGNWSEQLVPGPADTALFALSGQYAVSFKENAEVAKLRMIEAGHDIEPQKVTLELDGKTLTLLAPFGETSAEGPLVLTPSSQAPRILIFEGGTLRFEGFWQATFTGPFPAVLIFDKGMKIEGPGMGYTGAYGSGETYLIGGSKWVSEGRSWAGVLGHAGDAHGLFVISGPGSSFQATTQEGTPPLDERIFYVSTSGTGMLRILDGATFECDVVNQGNGVMGEEAFSTVVVDGENSRFQADRLNVGGGSNNNANPAQPAGNALFCVSNGAVANVGALKVFAREASENLTQASGRVLIDGGKLNLGSDHPAPSAEFMPGSSLEFRLRKPTGEAPLSSEAELKIEGSTLVITLDPAFRPPVGTKIPLVSCQTVTGNFAGLPDASQIEVNGTTFTVSYNMDGANLIGLTVAATK